MRRQKRYARALSKGGNRAAGIEELLQNAGACIADIAIPKSVSIPVHAEPISNGICLGGRVTLEGREFASAIADGASINIYLQTLSYEQAQAFEWLSGDYAAHHVLSDLGSEVLFAFSRREFQRQKDALPAGARLKRISVQTDETCGERRLWDAAKVQTLLQLLGDSNPGVSVTDTGCFQPLQTLLGLTITYSDKTGSD